MPSRMTKSFKKILVTQNAIKDLEKFYQLYTAAESIKWYGYFRLPW